MATRGTLLSSTVATKILIALTGLALVGFLVMHLIGNMLALIEPALFNEYAHALITNPLLIPAELGLAALFLLHAYKAFTNWLANRAARPAGYSLKRWARRTSRKGVGSSTMIYTGVITFVFLAIHLKTFKYGAQYLVPDSDVRDLYRLVIEIFGQPVYVGGYVVCMLLLGLHLNHGFSSAFQSMGLSGPRFTRLVLAVGKVVAVVIGGGFVLIPLWVYFMTGGRS